MRYKEQTLNNVEKVENLLKLLESQINRNERREEVLTTLENVKEKLENVKSLIEIESDSF